MHSEIPDFKPDDRRSNIIIKLINFRTYPEVTLRLPLNSVTLINGPSGVGKTTMLEAFMFLLYDGINNPERFKTKRCWGWLFIGDLIVYRQKDPSLLKVWRSTISAGNPPRDVQEFTQDDAQREINRVYGTQDVFCGCSYLKQKEFSVFLTGSDAEKLAVMKAVAMRGGELDELKAPIKNALTNFKEKMTSSRAQFELALRNIQNFDQRNPTLVKYQVPENSEEVMTKVRELRDAMSQFDRDFESAVQIEANINILRQQIDGLTQRKGILEGNVKQYDVTAMKAKLVSIEEKLKEFLGTEIDANKLAAIQLYKHWAAEETRLLAKIQEIEKDFEVCSVNIRKTVTEFPAYVAAGNDFNTVPNARETFLKQALEFIERWTKKFEETKGSNQEVLLMLAQINAKNVEEAQKILAGIQDELAKTRSKEAVIREELDKKRQANKMKCPSCQTVVIVGSDGRHLEKCQDAPQGIGAMMGTDPTKVTLPAVSFEDLAALASSVATISANRDRIQSVISAVDDKLKSRIGDVSPEITSALTRLFSTYRDLFSTLETLKKNYKNHQTLKPVEIQEPVRDVSLKTALEGEKKTITTALETFDGLQRQLQDIESNLRQFSQMYTEASVKSFTPSAEIRRRKAETQAQIDQLMHLSSATDLIGQRSILEKSMQERRSAAETGEREFKACERLLERMIEAERLSLEAAVNEINCYLSQILKRLFVGSPISVSLSTTKKLKSKKDAVSQRFDIQLFYNNSEYGNVKQLSGGEKDRLSLAITLAMSQKFGGSLLFLDETLSSLDAELKSEAVAVLKEFSGSRTVICISHEETEGLYDNVLRFKPKH